MADKVTVKVAFKEDIRRLPGSCLSSFAGLHAKIAELYGSSLLDGFVIKYQDEDKDFISVTSDLELGEAVREASRLPNALLRLSLFPGIIFSPRPAGLPKPAAVEPAKEASSNLSASLLPQLVQMLPTLIDQAHKNPLLLSSVIDSASDPAKLQAALKAIPTSSPAPGVAVPAPVPAPTPAPAPAPVVPIPVPPPAKEEPKQPAPDSASVPVAPVTATPAPATAATPLAPLTAPLPPTPAPAPNQTQLSLAAEPPKPEPVLGVEFVAHENFPEDTEVECGVRITKIWRVKNTGTLPWPVGTILVAEGGADPTGESTATIQKEVAPGQETTLGILVVTPKEAGLCQASWRFKTPNGRSFGDPLWLNLKIVRKPPPPKLADLPEILPPAIPVNPPSNPVSIQAALAAAANSPSPKPEHLAMQQAIASAQQTELEKQLKHLADMGFCERETNITLLAKHNGNLVAVITELIGA